MGRTIDEAIAALPPDRQERVETRFRELKDEVESLRELRQVAGKAQADVAAALKIKQPSVSKIERQADMYLSTLRSYVQAIGGDLKLVVRLPARAVRLQSLGDLKPVQTSAGAPGRTRIKTTRKRSTGAPRRKPS